MSKRIKTGDIFELETSKGKAYLHYVGELNDDGIELIRVLPGLFSELPENLNKLVHENELFMVQFPVKGAFKMNLVCKVGNEELKDFEKPQYMRTDFYGPNEQLICWHIVNTQTSERKSVGQLTDEQKKLSPWGIWNDTYLKERLEEGWTLEKWGNG